MIEMKHITKKYGDFTVFSDFSMEIPDGEVLCLMGKSGRGKTTLLRMLMELEQPDAGSINGLEGKKISVVFQEDRLLPGFTVRQNLYSVCDGALQQERMMQILSVLGLAEWIDREVAVLSGGFLFLGGIWLGGDYGLALLLLGLVVLLVPVVLACISLIRWLVPPSQSSHE